MALIVRLSRTGKHGQPSYKIVVAEDRSKRDGRPLVVLGHYNPSVKPPEIKIDQKTYEGWISKGAKPSTAVKKLLSKQ